MFRNTIKFGRGFWVTASVENVVHGSLEPNGDPATLIVMDFRLDVTDSRRARKVEIELRFLSEGGRADANSPEVYRIEPEGILYFSTVSLLFIYNQSLQS